MAVCQQCHHTFAEEPRYCPKCGAVTPESHWREHPMAHSLLEPEALAKAVIELQAQNDHLNERLNQLEAQLAKMQAISLPLQPKILNPTVSAPLTEQRQEQVLPPLAGVKKPSLSSEPEEAPACDLAENAALGVLEQLEPVLAELPVSPAPEWVQGFMPQPIETHATGQAASARQAVNLEEDIGLKWFSRIGIVALVLGIGLLIRLALVNHLVGYGTQIVLGVMVGLGMVAGGHQITRWEHYIHWGRTLIGGGFALTYFLVYAAYHFESYRLATGFNQWLDIVCLTLVVIGAIGMALWHNSRVIASGAFFLGYTTAFLSSQYDLQTLLYALGLSAGVVLVAVKRQWGDMGFASMAISYGFFALCQTMQPQPPLLALGLLWFIFTLYMEMSGRLKATVLKHRLLNAGTAMNLILAFLLAFVFQKQEPLLLALFALGYGAVFIQQLFRWAWDENSPTPQSMGALLVWQGSAMCLLVTWPWPLLGLALAYGLLYAVARWRLPAALPPLLAYLAVGYLSLSVFLLVNPTWITLVWIVESTLLVMVSYKLQIRALRLSHYALDGVITSKLLLLDLWWVYKSGEALAPLQGCLTGLAILSFYAIGFYLQRHPQLLDRREKIAPAAYVGVATVAMLFLSTFYLVSSVLTLAWLLLAVGFLALAHHWPAFRALLFYFYILSVLVMGKCWLADVRLFTLQVLPLTLWDNLTYGFLAAALYGLVWYGQRHFRDALGTAAIVVYTWCATALVVWLSIMNCEGVTLTACWLGLLTIVLLLFNRYPQYGLIRWHVYLGAIALVITFLVKDGMLEPQASSLRPLVALGIVAWLYGLTHLFERHLDPTAAFRLPPDEDWTPTALGVLGTVTLLGGIAIELDSYWVSIGWALAGFGLLYSGFALAHKILRFHGLAVLSLTIVKVFIWDIFSMEPLFRTLSFIVLGVLLLGAAFVYSRYRERLKGLL